MSLQEEKKKGIMQILVQCESPNYMYRNPWAGWNASCDMLC